jgi:alpha-L-rhamnosidase
MRYLNDFDYNWFDGRAKWIWSFEGIWGACPDPRPVQTRYFARRVDVQAGQRLILALTADSRYLLHLNGRQVARGPQVGDVDHQYYDVLDLTDDLRVGSNLLMVRVDSYAKTFPYYKHTGVPAAIMSAATVFVADAVILNADGAEADRVVSDSSWQVLIDPALLYEGDEDVPSYVGYKEILDYRRLPAGFFDAPELSGPGWEPATVVHTAFTPENVQDAFLPHRLIRRSVLPLHHEPRGFATVACVEGAGGDACPEHLDPRGAFQVRLPPHSRNRFVLDAGCELTAYPVLEVRDGAGSRITLRYTEKLLRDGQRYFGAYQPGCELTGYADRIVLGNGHTFWSPLHWRTFKYIEVLVETADEPLDIVALSVINCHYPLLPVAPFRCDDEDLNRFWDVGVRGQQCCAHYFFADCPYYEQLQYGGDAQTQALFSYWMSGDTTLARQALRFFHWSRTPEGLVQSRYPSRPPQIIPYWSLHYLLMLHDWYQYTGRAQEIRQEVLGAVNDLRWFLDRRQPDGLIGKLTYWCVADWSPEWRRDFAGRVPGVHDGPTALTNLMVIAAAERIGTLLDILGEPAQARWLRDAARDIRRVLPGVFWDPARGCYRDSPLHSVASQLTNAWAILTDLPDPRAQRQLAGRLDTDDGLCQAAYFGQFFLFEAWRKTGRQDLVVKHFQTYRDLLALGLTTWPESPGNPRSQCHAWSNAGTWSLLRTVLGFDILEPGCRRVRIQPYLAGRARASGALATPHGPVTVEFERTRAKPFRIRVPAGVEAEFEHEGDKAVLMAGEHGV